MSAPRVIAPGVEVWCERCFGEPTISGTRIPVSILYDRWAGGEPVEDIARDYDVPEAPLAMVTLAIAFEAGRRYREETDP